MAEEIGLIAVLVTRQFEKGVNVYIKGQEKITKTTEKTAKTVEKASKPTDTLGKSFVQLGKNILGLAATYVTFDALTRFVTQSFQAAAQAERLGIATDNLGKRFGVTGSQIVKSIQEASGYTISRMDAMRQANQAMLLGVAQDEKTFGRLATIAITLGRAMGQNAAKSVEDLTLALGRQSPLILDNLGISLKLTDAYKAEAAALGKQVSQLTEAEKKQAFYNEALRRGEEAVAQLGGIQQDTLADVEALSAAYTDLQTAFGGFLIDVGESTGIIDAVTGSLRNWEFVLSEGGAILKAKDEQIAASNEALADNAAATLKSVDMNRDLSLVLLDATADIEGFKTQLIASSDNYEDYNKAVKKAGEFGVVWNDILGLTSKEFAKARSEIMKGAGASREAGIAFGKSVIAQRELNEATRLAGIAATNVISIYDNLTISQRELAEAGMEAAQSQITLAKNAFAQNIPEMAGEVPRTQQELIAQQREFIAQQKFQAGQIDVDMGAVSKSISDGLSQIKSAIGQVSGLTFQEIIPVQETFRVDEWVRRLQAVATDGKNQWVDDLQAKFGGQEFFKPMEDAIASGDPSAIQAAAQGLISGPFLFELMDIEGAVTQVEALIAQQNLQQRINDAILAALTQKGVTAPATSGIGASTFIMDAIGLGAASDPAGQITTAITGLNIPGIVTQALTGDQAGGVMETSPLLTMLGLGPDGPVIAAVTAFAVDTLGMLTLAFQTMVMTASEQLNTTLLMAITNNDLALQALTNSTLPNLMSAIVAVTVAGKDGFEGMADAVESAAQKITGKLVPAINKATVAANALADAMARVAAEARAASNASRSATGTGFKHGVGFQAGTPANTGGVLGLGWKIPPGFNNDSFGPMFAQSGEEMLITPRGMSIESLIFSRLADLLKGSSVQGGSVTNNYYNFNMTVNTGADARTVVGQFNVMRALQGV